MFNSTFPKLVIENTDTREDKKPDITRKTRVHPRKDKKFSVIPSLFIFSFFKIFVLFSFYEHGNIMITSIKALLLIGSAKIAQS